MSVYIDGHNRNVVGSHLNARQRSTRPGYLVSPCQSSHKKSPGFWSWLLWVQLIVQGFLEGDLIDPRPYLCTSSTHLYLHHATSPHYPSIIDIYPVARRQSRIIIPFASGCIVSDSDFKILFSLHHGSQADQISSSYVVFIVAIP